MLRTLASSVGGVGARTLGLSVGGGITGNGDLLVRWNVLLMAHMGGG